MTTVYFVAHSDFPNIPVYIGKTKKPLNKRLLEHIHNSKIRTYRFALWIKSVMLEGKRPVIFELDRIDDDEWQFWEKYWISQMKVYGFELCNMSEGGQDTPHLFHTSESKLKLKNSLTGRKLSNEHIENIRKARTGWIFSDATKLKLSLKFKGRALSEEQKLKISITKKGVPSNKIIPVQQHIGDKIVIWKSATEASINLNISRNNIVACLKGRRPKAGNYKWSYVGCV